ncbi:MAG: Na+/H+ antiporter NhaA [Acidimicrobiales bacterium]
MRSPQVEPLHRTWIHSDRFVPRQFVRPALSFMKLEAASGIVMLIAAIAAVVWANTAFESYENLLHTHTAIAFGSWHLELHLGHLINDGLMAIFFFVVALEIKRELVMGELKDLRVAMLPVIAAVGGMAFPALIYAGINRGDTAAMSGWAVPMATDIAFSAGVLSLLGRRVPVGAKLFLLTLAIVDDLGGILVIAIFYAKGLALANLGIAFVGLALVALASKAGIRHHAFYIPLAVVVWYFFYKSGVHATLAGVAMGFLTPARPMYSAKELDVKARKVLDTYPANGETVEDREHADYEALQLSDVARESVSPLMRAEHRLAKWAAFAIIPVFALANAGVRFEGSVVDSLLSAPALGVALGLVLGKTIGISLFTVTGLKLGLGRLPAGMNLRHLVGAAATAGIGFTVALFITALAYTDTVIANEAKVGIFVGSIVAGILGAVIFLTAPKAKDEAGVEEMADRAPTEAEWQSHRPELVGAASHE